MPSRIPGRIQPWPAGNSSRGDIIAVDGTGALIFEPPIARGHITGLTLSDESTTTINIAAGECRGGTSSDQNLVNMRNTDITKVINTTWAAGDDAGGLNATDFASGTSGAEANKWYHVFLIEDANGTVDAGFDKNISATNLLADSVVSAAGFVHFRRIGSIYADGSELVTGFFQINDDFYWDAPTEDFDDALTTGGAELLDNLNNVKTDGAAVPGIKTKLTLNVTGPGSATRRAIWIYDPDHTASTPAFDGAPLANYVNEASTVSNAQQVITYCNTSQQIAMTAAAGTPTVRIAIVGWYDTRGRFD